MTVGDNYIVVAGDTAGIGAGGGFVSTGGSEVDAQVASTKKDGKVVVGHAYTGNTGIMIDEGAGTITLYTDSPED
jgi:hypothetical protein